MITNLYLLSDPVFHTHGNHNYYTEYSMPYEEGWGGGGWVVKFEAVKNSLRLHFMFILVI